MTNTFKRLTVTPVMPTRNSSGRSNHRERRRPGEVRDAIVTVLSTKPRGAAVSEIEEGVRALIGEAASSSIRSYLRLNSESLFQREDRGLYMLREAPAEYARAANRQVPFNSYAFGRSRLFEADCISWLQQQPENSIHAVVTDPPYGLVEYTSAQQEKLRIGKGGIWRIPPSFDGTKRSPLPRFTVLSTE